MRGAVWVPRCLSRVPVALTPKGTTTTRKHTRKAQMKVSEILTGNLESDIWQAIERLDQELPEKVRACISIHLYSKGSTSCFIGAALDGVDLGSAGFGQNSVTKAVDAMLKRYNDSSTVGLRRSQIQEQIEKLQAELDKLPESRPETAEEFAARIILGSMTSKPA